MNKRVLILLILIMAAALLLGQEQYEVTVTNIAVPVRVFEGGKFVDGLGIQDFDLFEDGKLQKIQALYLVRKNDLERKEALQDYGPQLRRHFYLLFQMTDYSPRLPELIEILFNRVLLPGDTLVIQTPLKNYALSPEALAKKPKDALAKEMNELLRKDIKVGTTEYNRLLADLKRIVHGIQGTSPTAGDVEGGEMPELAGLEYWLNRYKETAAKMEQERLMDEKKILRFAYALKRIEGQKNVFFIYQREFRPEIQPNVLTTLTSLYHDDQNIMGSLQDLFQFYTRDLSVDALNLQKAFADASINFNFIFMNKEPRDTFGISMREQSEDIFKAFSQVAQATGGLVDSSQNPAAGFEHAIANSEVYYLLYYSPKGYTADKQFKSISVKTKNPGYSVQHRHGYFAE